MAINRKKIGDLLVERGYITAEQLKSGLKDQAATGKRLGALLVERGQITEDQLIDTIAERLSIPRVTLSGMAIDPTVIHRVPVEIARRYNLIPIFSIGNTITLAMADPLNIIAIDEIKYHTNSDIKRAIATTKEIKEAIDQYYSVADSLSEIFSDTSETQIDSNFTSFDTEASETDTPVIKLVNLIISKAVKDKASDIHIEPDESILRIRYRIHGVMHEEASPPKSMQQEVISRIKVASNLDLSEKRLPQDGRFMTLVDGNPIDMRVSTLPTIHGEKMVIRILDRRNLMLTFNQLGFDDDMTKLWNDVIHKPEGLILLSGPTSSGKTSTLYTTLQEINSIEKNIVTVEDPVEYSLPLINQIQINEKAGLTFPTSLRSILRQNPDIIMIGEIRDIETAQIAIRSALTGHLVFSTIHTNDAASAITRLLDMGIESYLMAAGLKGVIAQRLVRVNCPNCLEAYKPSSSLLERAGLLDRAESIVFQRGQGCAQCRKTGYKGLIGIFEYICINQEISDLITDKAPLRIIRETAKKYGYVSLFDAGLKKLEAGTICLSELLKETSNIEDPISSYQRINAEPIHANTI